MLHRHWRPGDADVNVRMDEPDDLRQHDRDRRTTDPERRDERQIGDEIYNQRRERQPEQDPLASQGHQCTAVDAA